MLTLIQTYSEARTIHNCKLKLACKVQYAFNKNKVPATATIVFTEMSGSENRRGDNLFFGMKTVSVLMVRTTRFSF